MVPNSASNSFRAATTFPLAEVVRLAGTKFEEGKKILDNSGLEIISASDLSDAAAKIVKEIN